ncbi:hypothetical protein XAXN_20240 [Xanthomonas axonopodis]|uniref:Uncharacterized protein n=1 Tax=Xanthomonas axonopodis TaxID=53413 RepID=A0A0P6V5M4_9XANT|nr:hypothetical protein XAXN_20240 [Xanthomonas axonopodis]PPV09745.1 hypothetical protein XavaCFBP5823_12625 [Xanthomonas axonopodis pv. vasculorum]
MAAQLWKALLQLPARAPGSAPRPASARKIAQLPIGIATIRSWRCCASRNAHALRRPARLRLRLMHAGR